MNAFVDFIKKAFSENGVPSSKRILAGLMIVVALFCTTWSVIKVGMTENNKAIIETEVVSAITLLGVSNVTSIWKDKNNNTENNTEK